MTASKIIQYIHRPNLTELGLGNTNDRYLVVDSTKDMSDVFPLGVNKKLKDTTSLKEYVVYSKIENKEFRLKQLGYIVDDYNMELGDEIVITHFESSNNDLNLLTVNKCGRILLNPGKKEKEKIKDFEIVNIGKLPGYSQGMDYKCPCEYGGSTKELLISFSESRKKRTDSPAKTDFYAVKWDNNNLDNSQKNYYYYLTYQKGKIVLEVLPKSEYRILLEVKDIIEHSFNRTLQRIFYGAPGTGKSHTIKEEEKILDKDNVFRTTFHPDSDYASFVGAYKPTMREIESKIVPVVFSDKGTTFEKDSTVKENKIVYEFVPQVFLKAYIRAWQIWHGTTPSTTFGDVKVTVGVATLCKGENMAESGLKLVEEYIKTRKDVSIEDIVNGWNDGIGIGSPDFRLINEDADITKKPTWPSIDIKGEKYLFVKEIHGKFWKDFCDNVKKLFKQYGEEITVEYAEITKKKKKSDASLESPDESISQMVLLVIEEINRGNCAQIFGDIFQLLDRNCDGFSEYPIVPEKDLKDYVGKEFERIGLKFTDEQKNEINDLFDGRDVATDIVNGEVLVLPANLYIWATMNTSDQSLFPIDSAFKRRWDWKYIKITNAYKKDEKGNFILDAKNEKIPLNWKLSIEHDVVDTTGSKTKEKYDWWLFLQKINDIIASMTSSADKQLGYFFCKAGNDGIISEETFVSKVLFYLWNDVFKDYGFEDVSLFRYKNERGDEEDLTFPDFYDEDGDKVNSERVADFVQKVMDWSKKTE